MRRGSRPSGSGGPRRAGAPEVTADPDGVYVAVDLGASSGRVVAGRVVDGVVRAEEVARFANRPVTVPTVPGSRGGEPGVLHWDVLDLWREVLDGIAAAGRTGTVRSVGVDTWAVDYGLLGADGALLGSPVHYRDARTDGLADEFFAQMDPAAHYRVTGAQVQPFNTVFQLLAEARGSRFAAGQRLLLMPDLIGAWLGGSPVAEVTNASTTGLLDVRTRTWSPEVLGVLEQMVGRDVGALLGPVVEPGTVVGEVTTGAPGPGSGVGLAGVGGARVVTVGSHDTASAVVAVPMADPATAAYISSGTWSLVGLELDTPVLAESSRRANHTNELGVDGTVRYLKNVAGMWLLSESQRTWRGRGESADLAGLLSAAARAEPLRTVVDVTDESLVPPGDMPARIAALARASGEPVPGDPGETVRCILDSLALAYRRTLRELADAAGREVRTLHVVGGGSRNELLCRLTADATGLPVLAGPAEGAALGNLLVQARADGALHGDLGALRRVARMSSEVIRWEPSGSRTDWDAAESRLPGY